MDLTQLIEALSDPAAYPDPVGEVDVRQTHISAVFLAGHYRLQGQEARRTRVPRLQHAGQTPALLRGGGAPQPPPGPGGLPRGGAGDARRQGSAGGGRRRGRGVGGEDAAPARRSHPPKPPPAGGGRGPGGGGPGAQDRRLPRAGRVRPAGRRLRALRGGGRQRPRELRAVRGPRRHHRQRRRLRASAGAHRGGPGPPPRLDRVAGRAGRAPRHARRPAPGPRLLLPRPGAAGRPGHHRLHRVQRALPLRRSGVRHGLPGHGAHSPGPSGSGPGVHGGVLPGLGRRRGPRRWSPSTRPTGRPCGARWKA